MIVPERVPVPPRSRVGGLVAVVAAVLVAGAAGLGLVCFQLGRAGWSTGWGLSALGVVLVTAALGALLGRAIVRARAEHLSSLLEQVRATEAKIREVNRDLSEWAASAVREVQVLSVRLVNTQEQERGRIARDLHDSVGQALTALHYEIELIAEHPEAMAERIGRALKACEDALNELRQRVYDLRPPELTHTADIDRVLRSYAERYELRTGLPISFRSVGPKAESEELATCLLRVLQEALTNVTRHARAQEVGVALAINDLKASMEVIDDGEGFPLSADRKGSGLRGIEERCAVLGGSVEVESTPGQGTRLRVQLPLAGRTS